MAGVDTEFHLPVAYPPGRDNQRIADLLKAGVGGHAPAADPEVANRAQLALLDRHRAILQHGHHLLALPLITERPVTGGDLHTAAVAGDGTAGTDFLRLARTVALLAQTDPELMGASVELLDDVPYLLQRGGVTGMDDELIVQAAEARLFVRENLLQTARHLLRGTVMQSLGGDFLGLGEPCE